MLFKGVALATALGILGGGTVAVASDVNRSPVAGLTHRRHLLTVAANPELGYTDGYVDQLLRRLNEHIQKAQYPWDIACKSVEFVRNGPVISNPRLLLSGTADELKRSIATHAPNANVLVVAQITNCAGIFAAGCAPIGHDRMAVVHGGGDREPVIWFHERGHAIGLGHVAQGVPIESASQLQVSQTMFWNPRDYSTALLGPACERFRVLRRASVIAVPAFAPVAASSSSATSRETFGLTPNAFAAVDGPWMHGMDVKAVEALNDEDLDSIERVLSSQPNYLWRQLLLVIAYRRPNSASVEHILVRAATLPTPVGEVESAAASELRRISVTVRFAAVFAIGIQGNLASQPAKAIETLSRLARPAATAVFAGEIQASQLSMSSLEAAAIIAARGDSLGARALQQLGQTHPVLIGPVPVGANAPEGVVATSAADEQRIRDISARIRRSGVRNFLSSRDR